MIIALIEVFGFVDRLMSTAHLVLSMGLIFWIAVLIMLFSLGSNLIRDANMRTTFYCCNILLSEGDATNILLDLVP